MAHDVLPPLSLFNVHQLNPCILMDSIDVQSINTMTLYIYTTIYCVLFIFSLYILQIVFILHCIFYRLYLFYIAYTVKTGRSDNLSSLHRKKGVNGVQFYSEFWTPFFGFSTLLGPPGRNQVLHWDSNDDQRHQPLVLPRIEVYGAVNVR